jgi:hypothetical protein
MKQTLTACYAIDVIGTDTKKEKRLVPARDQTVTGKNHAESPAIIEVRLLSTVQYVCAIL